MIKCTKKRLRFIKFSVHVGVSLSISTITTIEGYSVHPNFEGVGKSSSDFVTNLPYTYTDFSLSVQTINSPKSLVLFPSECKAGSMNCQYT